MDTGHGRAGAIDDARQQGQPSNRAGRRRTDKGLALVFHRDLAVLRMVRQLLGWQHVPLQQVPLERSPGSVRILIFSVGVF